LHVKRKKEEDLTDDDKVVMDLSVGRLDPSAASGGQLEANEKWESRPCGLWIKRSTSRFASDSNKAVTAVDVLFGDDAVEAREGWGIVGTRLLLDSASGIPGTYITVRRGRPKKIAKPVPRIKDNGKFKIIQISDLHLSTGPGACREAIPDSYQGGKCEADPRTLDFVSKVIDEEKPDLIVFSGDQVNGDTSPDAQTVSLLFFITSRSVYEKHEPNTNSGYRPSSNMHKSQSSARSPTSPFSETTTMSRRCHDKRRCPSSNPYPTHFPRPDRKM
jgi:hypothetical protein